MLEDADKGGFEEVNEGRDRGVVPSILVAGCKVCVTGMLDRVFDAEEGAFGGPRFGVWGDG